MKTYPKICINCQTPFASRSKNARFCCKKCVVEFYKRIKKKHKPRVCKIDKELKEEGESSEPARTKCYLCGEEFYWSFEYSLRNGRRCPECVKKSRWS